MGRGTRKDRRTDRKVVDRKEDKAKERERRDKGREGQWKKKRKKGLRKEEKLRKTGIVTGERMRRSKTERIEVI